MVKQTFLNLSEDKRKRIIDIAFEEFASKPYGKASITNIVSRAGIAKGSMYQYFDDKKDLYLYLFDLAGEQKIKYMMEVIDPIGDFFTVLEQMIFAGIKFGLDNPLPGRIVANSMRPLGEELFQEVYEDNKKKAIDYFKKLLVNAQVSGHVRSDIDLELGAYFLNSVLGLGMTDYVVNMLDISMKELLADSSRLSKLSDDRIKKMVQEAMKFIRNGLEMR